MVDGKAGRDKDGHGIAPAEESEKDDVDDKQSDCRESVLSYVVGRTRG